MKNFCDDFITIVSLQAPLSVGSRSSSSSSVGNFSVDSHSYSEGRYEKAPKISVGVFEDEPAKTTANSASVSYSSLSVSDLGKPSVTCVSVEEEHKAGSKQAIKLDDGLVPPMAKQVKASLPTISLEELAKHSQEGDLWTAVDGLVYDVTNFKHPGGKAKILRGGGKDASDTFRKQRYY